MAKSLLMSALILSLIGVRVLSCEATVFTVGDIAGWDISADLQSWVANKIFNVGDVLLFQYSRYQNVNEVNSAGYNSCNTTNAMLTASNGNTSVPLTAPGKKYFISGVPLYCFGGMRLQLNVQGGGNGPAPSPVSNPDVRPESPPSRPGTDDNNLSPPVTSGVLHGRRGSVLENWIFTIGVLLLLLYV